MKINQNQYVSVPRAKDRYHNMMCYDPNSFITTEVFHKVESIENQNESEMNKLNVRKGYNTYRNYNFNLQI